MTLRGHSPVAGRFKCNPSNICAIFCQISTDNVLARSLSDSWASSLAVLYIVFRGWIRWELLEAEIPHLSFELPLPHPLRITVKAGLDWVTDKNIRNKPQCKLQAKILTSYKNSVCWIRKISVFRLFKMAAAAILNFQKFKFLTAGGLRTQIRSYHTKFYVDWSNRCGDITI